MSRRVVVTGLGAISPIGNTVDVYWENLLQGKCGIDEITSFDISDAKVKIAAEIKGFDSKEHFDRKQVKRLDRFSHLGMVAAREAYEDAGLTCAVIDRDRFGIVMGTGVGGMHTLLKECSQLNEKGMNFVSPLFVPKFLPNIVTGNITIDLDIRGISNTVITACAAGTNAIGEAFRAIKHGYADVMLAGGSEACITPLMMAGFTNLNALSMCNDPKRASIPFDAQREGFVLGEGAGILVLEDYEHAKARGAKIYAEVSGYGFTSDAYHLTAPRPDGDGASKAIKLALEEARISIDDISYINAHGTSTPLNDAMETKAIKDVFGEKAYKIPISSTKSMIGHLQGAAGAVEAVACIKSLETNQIHATIGYQEKDDDCDLDYVTEGSRKVELNYVLSNSFGFGGHNAAVVFGRLAD